MSETAEMPTPAVIRRPSSLGEESRLLAAATLASGLVEKLDNPVSPSKIERILTSCLVAVNTCITQGHLEPKQRVVDEVTQGLRNRSVRQR